MLPDWMAAIGVSTVLLVMTEFSAVQPLAVTLAWAIAAGLWFGVARDKMGVFSALSGGVAQPAQEGTANASQ